MRIASVTMVGQFPCGVDLHVRNLRWALSGEDHIFVVTTPEIIKEYKLKSFDNVTFLPFEYESGKFIHFWRYFDKIIGQLGDPDWYLFMEEDIYFDRKVGDVPAEPFVILNYLKPNEYYHSIIEGGRVIHPRVWEGANLVNAGVVRNAVAAGVRFDFVRNYFWEGKGYGSVSMKDFRMPDTFDEFGYWCALVERTRAEWEDSAVHLRGPESVHRKFPAVYAGATDEDLTAVQKEFNYFDAYEAAAVYYVVGAWKEGVDWKRIKKPGLERLRRLESSAWMKEEERARLAEILSGVS